jgi:cytochrome c-type biogenesis protein CcmH/NrfG
MRGGIWISPGGAFLVASIGLFGIAMGYAIASRAAHSAPSRALQAPADSEGSSASPLDRDAQITAFRNILAADPGNLNANIELGNLLYDAGRYAEAVPYYRRALELQPTNVNVSTDLGTALYYSGHPDEALAQYERSLQRQPNHPQTLFNIGTVRLEGKQDPAGALEVWNRLVTVHPDSPEAAKARSRIAEARNRLLGFELTPVKSTRPR